METEIELASAVRAGDRRALARAITIVESTRDDHREQAAVLLQELLPATGEGLRLGISGAPGAGKSTLIEAFGLHAIEQDHRVAVLAVDPSSVVTGGSILGDKTRMAELGRHPDAFIRPSPSSGTLGGVTRRTREAMLVCEAAGFDVVVIETVGVGQSEVAVDGFVDLFLLIASPAGGDELQGIKRGIMELADVIAVNKADGDLAPAAQRAVAHLRHAVQLLRPKRPGSTVEVLSCSALTGQGIPELWNAVETAHGRLGQADLAARRAEQNVGWMWSEVTDSLIERLRADPRVQARVEQLESAVADSRLAPPHAALDLLEVFLSAADDHP